MLEAHHKMKLFFAVRPWEDEPDNAEWTQEPSGYKCRIKRNDITGTLCGYVGIPKEHRFWGIGYEEGNVELSEIEVDVHGGITYSAEGKDGWWYFGFDTAHMDDFCPKIVETTIAVRGTVSDHKFNYWDSMNYRTWEFVEDEIHWLGKRLWQYNNYEKEGKDA
jgi:hypothetical protein